MTIVACRSWGALLGYEGLFARAAVAAALTGLFFPVSQSSAQVLVFINRGDPLASCLKEGWTPRPKDIEANSGRAEKGIRAYLGLASAGADVSKWFVGSKKEQHWALDGITAPTNVARDPWAARIARLERTAIITGGNRTQFRAVWKAFSGEGVELGTYDAWLQAGDGGARLLGLDLYSPTSAAKPKPLTAFCITPGDIENWREQQAQRQAAKAPKSNKH